MESNLTPTQHNAPISFFVVHIYIIIIYHKMTKKNIW